LQWLGQRHKASAPHKKQYNPKIRACPKRGRKKGTNICKNETLIFYIPPYGISDYHRHLVSTILPSLRDFPVMAAGDFSPILIVAGGFQLAAGDIKFLSPFFEFR
jgi:hypothetical protein